MAQRGSRDRTFWGVDRCSFLGNLQCMRECCSWQLPPLPCCPHSPDQSASQFLPAPAMSGVAKKVPYSFFRLETTLVWGRWGDQQLLESSWSPYRHWFLCEKFFFRWDLSHWKKIFLLDLAFFLWEKLHEHLYISSHQWKSNISPFRNVMPAHTLRQQTCYEGRLGWRGQENWLLLFFSSVQRNRSEFFSSLMFSLAQSV